MGKAKKKKAVSGNTIIQNKKARHDYELLDHFEAGMVLEGWEVKSLRAGRVQLQDSHVHLKRGEAWLLNCLITPLPTASTHISPQANRYRKLLLHRNELDQLVGAVDRKGLTVIATRMYWKHGRAKVDLALARGKKEHDKRADLKNRDWSREKQRILKHG